MKFNIGDLVRCGFCLYRIEKISRGQYLLRFVRCDGDNENHLHLGWMDRTQVELWGIKN